MQPCPHNSSIITRYEAFHKVKPNIQNIKLLSIISIVIFWREITIIWKKKNGAEHELAFYVGPAFNTPGAIKSSICITNNQVGTDM